MGREWTWWWEGDGYVVGRYCGELRGGTDVGGSAGGRDDDDGRKDSRDGKSKDGKDNEDGSHENARKNMEDKVGYTKDGVKAGPSIRFPALPQPLPTPPRSGHPTAASTPNAIPKPVVSHSMPNPYLVSPFVPSSSSMTAQGPGGQLPTPIDPVTGGSSTSLNANSQAMDSHSMRPPALATPVVRTTESGLPTSGDNSVMDGFPTLSMVSSNVDIASLGPQPNANRHDSVSTLPPDTHENAQRTAGLPARDFGPIPNAWFSRVFPRERGIVKAKRGDPTVKSAPTTPVQDQVAPGRFPLPVRRN